MLIQSTYVYLSTVIELSNSVQTLIIIDYRATLILYFSHFAVQYYFSDTK